MGRADFRERPFGGRNGNKEHVAWSLPQQMALPEWVISKVVACCARCFCQLFLVAHAANGPDLENVRNGLDRCQKQIGRCNIVAGSRASFNRLRLPYCSLNASHE